jgi:ADP-heptose:LPS heptosyltransferase
MRFLCVKQPVRANIFGQDYHLKPLDSQIENIEDLLVTDNFSAYELLTRHQDLLCQVNFDIRKCRGFPRLINNLTELEAGGIALIMRNGGIGDHIMFLPALRVFREMFPPDIQIWLATQKEKHPLFDNNLCIDRLYPLPLRLDVLLKADYLIDFSYRNDWYDLDRLHMTDSFLNFLNIDYEKIEEKTPKLEWDTSRSPEISSVFKDLRKANPGKLLIMLNWKSSNYLRDLPPEKLLFLSKEFKDVIFVIAQSKALSEEAAKLTRGYGDNIFNCSSKMDSLTDYITAVANCDAVVSTDTATGHLAEALGKYSLIIFGPTKEDLWIRYYQKMHPLRPDYYGRTCRPPCGLIKNVENGCPEALLMGSLYSPCLLSIANEKICLAFQKLIKSIS